MMKKILLALLLLLTLPAGAQTSSYEDYLGKGITLYQAKKYQQAEQHFTAMLRKFGDKRTEINGWIKKCKAASKKKRGARRDVGVSEEEDVAQPQAGPASNPHVPVSEAQAARNRQKELEKRTVSVGEVTFTMVKVEAGTFIAGSGEEGSARHYITLTDDYYIGETEVTQALWTAVMGENPSEFKENKVMGFIKKKLKSNNKYANHPVENVSWDDCQAFIERLNAMTGLKFRLPTEAEWEYAARGGNRTFNRTYCGSNDAQEVAWFLGNSEQSTHPVGGKVPNELGLYDMGGNVAEWCANYIYAYPSVRETNPQGPKTGSIRAYRGGSWHSDASYCGFSLYRPGAGDADKNSETGLRLVM